MTQAARKNLPIGISDYKYLIEQNYYYIDKTLLIRQLWNAGQVVLVTRPRTTHRSYGMAFYRKHIHIKMKDNIVQNPH